MVNRISTSVVIPCYNSEAFIRDVIESLLNQSVRPDEIIVVDDASQDGSIEIVKTFPVEVIEHASNRGPAIARNTGLHQATGDIVIFVDSDAFADENLVSVLLDEYHQSSDKNLAGVGGRGIEANINTIYDRWRSIHSPQDFGPNHMDDVPYLFGLCASYNRIMLLNSGCFDPFYRTNAGEDLDLGLRLHRQGYHLRYTPDALVYHQHTDNYRSLMSTQYKWTYWSYLAKRRTKAQSWKTIAGVLRRSMVDPLHDLIVERSLRLAVLNVPITLTKLRALYDALRHLLLDRFSF